MTWVRLTLNNLYNEIFGEPVDHPIIVRGLAYVIDCGAFLLWTILYRQGFGAEKLIGRELLLFIDVLNLTAYFTLANSRVFGGQSLGKLIFRIRVVDQNANYLEFNKSLIRALPITLLTNGLAILPFVAEEYVSLLFVVFSALTSILFGVLYFSILKLNRQGLHDIVAGSQVIPKSRQVTTKNSTNLYQILGYILITAFYLIYMRLYG